jgi:nucleoside-diphosphate-sugar epimerase
MTGKRILIAGCGRLGTRLGTALDQAGAEVHGLRRHPRHLPAGITPLAADLLADPDLSDRLPPGLDQVYYILTPQTTDDAGYKAAFVTGLTRLLEALSASGNARARVIFVSSTGVYGQDQGEWVDEASVTEPTRFSGRRLLEAETCLRRHPGVSVVVRFAGIYGPERDSLVRRVRSGRPCTEPPPRYTNRIHEDDCIGVLTHVGQLAAPAPLYIGVDDAPCTQCEVMDWLASALGQQPPRRTPGGTQSGRRCLNQRLRASGYRFRYPSYRQGYQRLVRAGV